MGQHAVEPRDERGPGRPVGPPGHGGPRLRGHVDVHDLTPGVHPGVGASGDDEARLLGRRTTVARAAASSDWTVRSPGCWAQPEKSVPS